MAEKCYGFPAFGTVPWRVRRWGLLLVGAYVVADLTVAWLLAHHRLAAAARPYVGILPSLLFIALIAGVVWMVRSRADEMLLRIHYQAATFAFIVTVLAITVFDGLAQAGIYNASRADVEIFAMLPWAAAIVFLAWRYR